MYFCFSLLLLSCLFFSCTQKKRENEKGEKEIQVRFDSIYHFIVNSRLMSHEKMDTCLALCDELTSVSPFLLAPRQLRLWNNSFSLSASYYLDNNEPKKALELLQRGIAVADSLGDKACLNRATNLLALIYSNWNLDKEANSLFDKMLVVSDKSDALTMGNIYLAKALHLAYTMKYDSAAYYVSLIDRLHIKKEDMLPGSYKSVDYSIRFLKGWYLTETPDSLRRAIELLQGLYDEYSPYKEQAVSFESVCFRLGRAYDLAGDRERAIRYYNEAKHIIMESKPAPHLYEVASPLMDIFLKYDDMKSAVEFLPAWKTISERYSDNQLRGMLAYYSIKLDVVAKEKELIKTEDMLFRKRIQVIGLSLLVILLIVLVVWGIIYWRDKKRQLHVLFETLMRRYIEWREINLYLANHYSMVQTRLLVTSETDEKESLFPENGEKGLDNNDFYYKLYHRVLLVMKNEQPFLNPDLTLSSLAQMLMTNRTYLSVAINRVTGVNFSVWLAEYRVNYAIDLMNKSEADNMDLLVYEKAGFSSRSTFYRQFKQITGLSPKQYLKRRTR